MAIQHSLWMLSAFAILKEHIVIEIFRSDLGESARVFPQIGVDVTIGKLGNLFIPRIIRPLLQNPFVRIHGSLRQSFGCFIAYEAGDCLAEWQRVLVLLPLKFAKSSCFYIVFGFVVQTCPKNNCSLNRVNKSANRRQFICARINSFRNDHCRYKKWIGDRNIFKTARVQ